jgi:OOP family OmpA-OmpF porin
MRSMCKGWLAALLVLLLTAAATTALAQKRVQDHPIIKPLPEVIKKQGEYKRFEAHNFPIKKEEGSEEKEVRGEYWYFDYQTKPEISGLEILENYKQAALEKNGQILYEDRRQLVFTLPTPEGDTLWAHVNNHGWDARYDIHIIKEKPLKKTLTFGAAQMKRELETKGEVTVYGINFDFDKATLRPGSERVLMEVVKLLQSSPDLMVQIQGHTCNMGGRDYNLKLSQARSETVKAFLIQHGIAESRLTAQGYGMGMPVASNDTEEGRAKNRRVVFKKL